MLVIILFVMAQINCGRFTLDITQPQIMAILNVTPDSFSDGGQFSTVTTALKQAEKLITEGAAILDVGGESTRPGARTISEQEEIRRVVPVIEQLVKQCSIPISIDTSKPEVMCAAVNAGACFINDVRALQWPGALAMAVRLQVPVCLMHMRGQPHSMQDAPVYTNVIQEVADFLASRLEICVDSGLHRNQLLIDPGFGFGKTLAHNIELLAHLHDLTALKQPIMVGLSRKSMLGALTQTDDVKQRLPASLAAALLAAERGACLLRVHDVAATKQALQVLIAIQSAV
jgi:dihydropteroate synthase